MILCLLTIVLAILDQNIVSSAIVPIVKDLDPVHGLDHVAWRSAAYSPTTATGDGSSTSTSRWD